MFKHGEQVKSRSWLRIFMYVLPIVIVFSLASLFAVNRWYEDNLRPLSASQTEDVIVVIEPGSSLRDISDQLKDLGVIRNSTVFSWYVGRNVDRGSLQAGTYRLNPGLSVEAIVERMVAGDVATNLITIFPGQRLDQIEEDFVNYGFEATEVSDAFSKRYDHPLFENMPSNATLEGYVFPDTYEIAIGETVSDILERSFDEFYESLDDELLRGIRKQKLSLHEAVTLASIVEKESANLDDQEVIAQVFLTRLARDITLGSDPTFLYAAAVTNQAPAVDLDHPYNTRIYGGLPPGPISNFNLSALEAVANPADTDYLYFVAGDDGTTYFSKTQAEHDAKTIKYCDEACKLPDSVE